MKETNITCGNSIGATTKSEVHIKEFGNSGFVVDKYQGNLSVIFKMWRYFPLKSKRPDNGRRRLTGNTFCNLKKNWCVLIFSCAQKRNKVGA